MEGEKLQDPVYSHYSNLYMEMTLSWSTQPYISPTDFDLANQSLRHELLKHIGQEYNGIIDADIPNKESNAKKVDKQMGSIHWTWAL